MRALVFVLVLGCSSSKVTEAPPRTKSALPLFGDDRVADVLARDPAKAPTSLLEHEAQFHVGRACEDVFVVEERATRQNNMTLQLDRVVPRVVYGACRDGLVADLFTVVPTDPARPASDPLVQNAVETMALDRTTKKYGFYVFDANGVTRIFEDHGKVRTIVGSRNGQISELLDGDRRCFSCHVHAEPLMPTPSDPWTNWVSSRHRVPQTYSGETAAIVGKTSFADALEPIVRNAIRAMVVAGDVDARPAFCATSVQFATAPLAMYVDPGAVAGSGIVRPTANAPDLFPVRADFDLRMEAELVARGLLAPETVIALRLVDDQNDAFSAVRCALLPAKFEGDAQVRAILQKAFEGRTDKAAIYAKALLSGTGVDSARAAYFDEVRARFTTTDAETLATRLADRRAAARALFPGAAHPIPIAALP